MYERSRYLRHSYAYKIVEILLSALGAWPYQNPSVRFIAGLFITIILMSPAPKVIEALYYHAYAGRVDNVLKMIPAVTLWMGIQIKFFDAFLYQKKTKNLVELMSDETGTIPEEKDEDLTRSSKYVEIFIYFYVGFCLALFMMIAVVFSIMPEVLDSITSSEEEFHSKYNITFNSYYIDRKKYLTVYMINEIVLCFIITLVASGTDPLQLIFINHICMKLVILRHLMINLMNDEYFYYPSKENRKLIKEYGFTWKSRRDRMSKKKNELHVIKKQMKFNGGIRDEIVHRRIIFCIKEHKKILRYHNLVQSKYSMVLALIVMNILIGLFVTGFQVVKNLNRPLIALLNLILLMATLIYLYFQQLLGQRLIDHSDMLMDSLYACPWVKMPLKSQKLLFLMIIKSQRTCKIRAGYLCIMSLETFKQVVIISLSYFTALTSIYMNNKIYLPIK